MGMLKYMQINIEINTYKCTYKYTDMFNSMQT